MSPRWEETEYRRGRTTVTALRVHLVFVTKWRRNVFNDAMLEYLKSTFERVLEAKGATLVECDGEDDHVHLLIEYPPQESVSELVNRLKGVSSRRLRNRFPDVKDHRGSLWAPSYFAASAGGASIDVLRSYIQSQRDPG